MAQSKSVEPRAPRVGTRRANSMDIHKPPFESLAWRSGIAMPPRGMLWEQKIDGKFATMTIANSLLVGERTPDYFWPFDCLQHDGQDIRALPLIERRRALDDAVSRREKMPFQDVKIRRPATGSGGEFLDAILANGGEGVVVKSWSGVWGDTWTKIKRSAVFYCVVTDLDGFNGSAWLADVATAEKRGKVALHGRFQDVKIGSVLKVEGYGLTARGMIREPRLDKDTPTSWLVKY